MRTPFHLLIYQGASEGELDYESLRAFLQLLVPDISVHLRGEFISHFVPPHREKGEKIQALARALAQARVRQVREKWKSEEPLVGEIAYELRHLLTPSRRPIGVLYDAWQLQEILRGLLPSGECNRENVHVVITNQLFGTWDEANLHYHCRTAFFGFPSLISTTGLVEAPAKPKNFYLKLRLGIPRELLIAEFQGRILDPQDPRMTEVVKGYVLQALFYHLTGDPFCSDPDCRLFNAHWQEELIRAQLREGADLCPGHHEFLKKLFKEKEVPNGLLQ